MHQMQVSKVLCTLWVPNGCMLLGCTGKDVKMTRSSLTSLSALQLWSKASPHRRPALPTPLMQSAQLQRLPSALVHESTQNNPVESGELPELLVLCAECMQGAGGAESLCHESGSGLPPLSLFRTDACSTVYEKIGRDSCRPNQHLVAIYLMYLTSFSLLINQR